MNYKLKCSCLYLYVSKWDTVLFARLCVSSQCDPAGSRLDHRWLGLRAIPPRPQSSDGRGLTTQQTNASFRPKTSGVWTPASCEEWGSRDSPSASLWGQLAHPTGSLQSKHRRTQVHTLKKLCLFFYMFIYLFFYPAEQGLFQDMFNDMTLVSCQIFVSSVPL